MTDQSISETKGAEKEKVKERWGDREGVRGGEIEG